MSNPLLSDVLAQVRDGLHPGAVRVEAQGGDLWAISILFEDWCRGNPFEELNGPLPCGVGATIHKRVADFSSIVSGTDNQIRTWMLDLARKGNAVDVARFDRSDGARSYLTKPNRWLPDDTRQRIGQ